MTARTDSSSGTWVLLKPLLALAFLLALGVGIVMGLEGAALHLLAALALAYLFHPIVEMLEERGIRRTWAVLAVIVLVVLVVLGLLLFTAVYLYRELTAFAAALPDNTRAALEQLQKLADRLGLDVHLSQEDLLARLKTYAANISPDVAGEAAAWLKSAFSSTAAILVSLLNIYLLPVFFFYIVHDYEEIVDGARGLVPRWASESVDGLLSPANDILKAYFRGQIVLCVIRALLYGVGLLLLGLDFGPLIGLLTGLATIVPYVGVTLGLVASLVIVLATGGGLPLAIAVVVLFAVVTIVDQLVLRVRLIERRTGLSDLTIMLALMIGGNWFGILGILLAIPAAGILKLLLVRLRDAYRRSRYFLGPEVIDPMSTTGPDTE